MVFIESTLTFIYDFGTGIKLTPGVNELKESPVLEKTMKSPDFTNRVKIGQFKVVNEPEAKRKAAEIVAEAKRRDEEGKKDGEGDEKE